MALTHTTLTETLLATQLSEDDIRRRVLAIHKAS